jgi:hypothetical protein
VITVGKARSIGVQNIALEYTKKIQHYCRFEDVQVRSNPKNTRDVSAQIASEGEYVMRLISAKEWVCSTYQFCSSNNLFLIFAFSNLQRNLLQICCVQGYAIVCVADYDVEDVN